MKRTMSDFTTLDIFLHDEKIGILANLPGDKNLLSFHQQYIDNSDRATLSLSFQDINGDLISNQKVVRTRLPPFFANLLPEGHMRDYLASQAGVNPQREFYLLAALGKDLPGALKVSPTNEFDPIIIQESHLDQETSSETGEAILRFSLAGVQLKFSAIGEAENGLTIPIDGVGGAWIVKLPSSIYAEVPENEYVMMELARHIGIDVPETALISIDQIKGLPKEMQTMTNQAFIIKRFDRDAEGRTIHIEDFAQVFGVFPEKKYRSASYRNIAQVIWSEVGEKGIIEFIRRFVFNALIGNGDMHLKNWSLIYPNKKEAELAPAYDFISTIPYLPNDTLALTFVDSKKFSSLTYEQFRRFAAKGQLPEDLVLDTVKETARNFAEIWKSIDDFKLNPSIRKIINTHLKTIPFYRDE
jgi:serine/threonine-protein kinase HipA